MESMTTTSRDEDGFVIAAKLCQSLEMLLYCERCRKVMKLLVKFLKIVKFFQKMVSLDMKAFISKKTNCVCLNVLQETCLFVKRMKEV